MVNPLLKPKSLLTVVETLWSELAATDRPWPFDRRLATLLKERGKRPERDGGPTRTLLGDLLLAVMRHAGAAAYAAAPSKDFVTHLTQPSVPPEECWRLIRTAPATAMVRMALARDLASSAGSAYMTAPELDSLRSELAREIDHIKGANERARSAGLANAVAAAGLPAWFAPKLARRAETSPDFNLRAFLEQLALRPPLWLRIADPEKRAIVIADLSADYEILEERGLALRVRGARPLGTHPLMETGAVEIQDLASQAIGAAVAATPGTFLWDACAGRGGKTLQLAAAQHGRGALYASDIDEKKLDVLKKRAARAGFAQVRPWPWKGDEPATFAKEVTRRGGFDAVLVDAPCGSSGTFRRNPEMRYAQGDVSLASLVMVQRRLLALAAEAVVPGGLVVYGTCSFLVEENEEIVSTLAAARPDLEILAQGVHGGPADDADLTFVARAQRAK